MVRNWFVERNDESNPDFYSLDDTIGDILKSEDIQGMVKGAAGALLKSPLIAIVKPFTLRQVLSLPIIKIDESMVEMAADYLGTIKKA